jgi:hypothetical protein
LADCGIGEAATTIFATGATQHALTNDWANWITDYDAFVAAVGLSVDEIS